MDTIVVEKPAIIIDIGHAYTKCGFAGDHGPHSIISSKVSHEINRNQAIKVYDYKALIKYLSDETSSDFRRKESEVLREMLIEFLYRIYYKLLNTNARERKVVIVESILTPSFFRKTLADVLFKNFQAVSVLFIPSHLASLYTLGINNALVVDCGYADCQIMPISESIPMTGQCDFINLGGKRLHSEIEEIIKNHSYITKNKQKLKFTDVEPPIQLSEETLEDIKLRCCFISTLERSRDFWSEISSLSDLIDNPLFDFKFKFAPDCDYNLYDNMVLHVPGYVREMALDIIFVDKMDSSQTIQNLILDTLVKCPIDLKTQLAENVILMGGTCMLEGFKSRLVSEINFLLSEKIYSDKLVFSELGYHVPPCLENYTAWLGGAIFGNLDILDTYSIQLSKYKDMVSLPDWFTIQIKNDMVQI